MSKRFGRSQRNRLLQLLNQVEHERDRALADTDFWSSAHDKVEAERDQYKAQIERLKACFEDLMNNSVGVAGLHLNGDIAPWSSLTEGGRFEAWLSALSETPSAQDYDVESAGWRAIESAQDLIDHMNNPARRQNSAGTPNVAGLVEIAKDRLFCETVTGLSLLTPAARSVLEERARQVYEEGWKPSHDDSHVNGEMASAAGYYALASGRPYQNLYSTPLHWPWNPGWWKLSTPRRNLVKAGALILAEIERLDRLQVSIDPKVKE